MPTSPLPDLERPVYFDGQRLAAADLGAQQAYGRELRWLHNRSLHGWGIATGLPVTGKRGSRLVSVGAGYALDALGRELVLAEPRTLAVPPVAQEEVWYLTISYDDEPLVVDERGGECGTRGAVRLSDEPLLRWLPKKGKDVSVRPGLDVILATATIADCALLRDLSVADRRALVRAQPYVYAGATQPNRTDWRFWPDESRPAGIATTVSTAEAGFRTTPAYQARVAGDRIMGMHYYDGFASVAGASATSFELRIAMPISTDALMLAAAGGSDFTLNPVEDFNSNLLASLEHDLYWYVVWLGVEV